MKKLTRFYYAEETKEQNGLRTVDLRNENDGITIIGNNAFEDDATVQKIILPTSLHLIEQNAFHNCKELQIVEIAKENSDSTQKHYAVENQKATENTTEEKTVDDLTIQCQAFKGCEKLHTVELKHISNLTIEKEAFAGCIALRTVVVPYAKVQIADDAFYGLDGVVFVTTAENEDINRFAREHDFKVVKNA